MTTLIKFPKTKMYMTTKLRETEMLLTGSPVTINKGVGSETFEPTAYNALQFYRDRAYWAANGRDTKKGTLRYFVNYEEKYGALDEANIVWADHNTVQQLENDGWEAVGNSTRPVDAWPKVKPKQPNVTPPQLDIIATITLPNGTVVDVRDENVLAMVLAAQAA